MTSPTTKLNWLSVNAEPSLTLIFTSDVPFLSARGVRVAVQPFASEPKTMAATGSKAVLLEVADKELAHDTAESTSAIAIPVTVTAPSSLID